MPGRPSVLFVCVKNSGKSQMAAGLMRQLAGDSVEIHSAGTAPGANLNPLSVQSLAEVGVDISAEKPKPIDPALQRRVDIVVVVGGAAQLEPLAAETVETWRTDEPSERGIEGIERMRLIRDDIARRVDDLFRRVSMADPGMERSLR